MGVKEKAQAILEELTRNSNYLDDAQLDAMIEQILKAKHIFTVGAGRSGVAMKAFTNRLMHLGLSVSSVGEITSPHTQAGDLLIIGSGSGETESLTAMAKKARVRQVNISLITMDPQSAIAEMSDVTVVLPGVSPKLKNAGLNLTSIQPMGNAFEQMCFLVYDAIVMELMERTGETSESMFTRHADFE